jgi:hypothetical protein
MDYFDALEVAYINQLDGDLVRESKDVKLLTLSVRWMFTLRYLIPREAENTAPAIRFMTAVGQLMRRKYVQSFFTPNYRIKYYANKFKEETPTRVPEST